MWRILQAVQEAQALVRAVAADVLLAVAGAHLVAEAVHGKRICSSMAYQ